MRLERLQDSNGEATVGLSGAVGLVGFVDDGAQLWGSFIEAFHDAFGAHGGVPSQDRVSVETLLGPTVVVGTGSCSVRSKDFDALLAPVLRASGLTREEYAAVWYGAGPVPTWLRAGRAMMHGSESASEIDRLSAALDSPGAPVLEAGADDAVTDWMTRLISKTRADVEALIVVSSEIVALEGDILARRAEIAEVEGDVEAGMVSWVRERQDAETRLLLYRDRELELRKRLELLDEKGDAAPCAACHRPLANELEAVRGELSEEWESVVQDGRWWRRRRDQLEFKPDELKDVEAKALALSAGLDDDVEALERRRSQRSQGDVVRERLAHLLELASELGVNPVELGSGGPRVGVELCLSGFDEAAHTVQKLREARDRLMAEARSRLRARIHGKVTALTAGRLVGVFPGLFEAWERGGRRGGGEVSILELAARITLAELAVEAGVDLGSILFPTSLDRLNHEDLPRALADLARLTRKVPLVLVKVTETVASAAPERFDLLFRADVVSGVLKVRRQRSGVGSLWLQPGAV